MIKILYCCECKTYTNHCQLNSKEWQCWCARIEPIENEVEGSDTSMEIQLHEAGFDSGGVL